MSLENVDAESTQLIIKREVARRSLLAFTTTFNESYTPGWVHKDVCARLEQFSRDVADKKSPRLMLFMPPRHGKSELATRNFPAWHLGHHPEHEVICCSYASSLAFKFSRAARELVRAPEYSQIFENVMLDNDAQNLENWLTTAGGGYMAAGVSGPLTGNGMHVGIIDDPVKNREEAESENVRQSQKDWYTSTFYTRLAPGGGILIILTRWHHDDLAGWLLEEAKNGGDQWEVIRYPAVAEEDEIYRKKGEPLHAARYPIAALDIIKRAIGPRDWGSLYQQNPVPDSGDYFKRSDIRYYNMLDRPPLSEMQIYTAWDLAVGKKDYNDCSAGVTIGFDRQERIWVLDVVYGRWGAFELVDKILDVYVLWGSNATGLEHGQISMSIEPFLLRRVRERKLYGFYSEPLKTGRADKLARARSIQGRMQQGLVFFPSDAAWMEYMLNEMLSFPNGVHDDTVDALAWLGMMMEMFAPSRAPREVDPPSWRDSLRVAQGSKNFMAS